jgi:hypothetical protein
MGRRRSPGQAKRKNGLNIDTHDLTVRIIYQDVEQTFSGTPEDVWASINRFFGQLLPTFDMAKKLTLYVDLQTLVGQCEGLIAFSSEGPNLLIPRDKLTDNETLSLLLLAAYIGFKLGKNQIDAVSKDTLQAKLGKDMKISSTRLGELIKTQTIMKTDNDEYRITTFGLLQMQKDILPKIKAKTHA